MRGPRRPHPRARESCAERQPIVCARCVKHLHGEKSDWQDRPQPRNRVPQIRPPMHHDVTVGTQNADLWRSGGLLASTNEGQIRRKSGQLRHTGGVEMCQRGRLVFPSKHGQAIAVVGLGKQAELTFVSRVGGTMSVVVLTCTINFEVLIEYRYIDVFRRFVS